MSTETSEAAVARSAAWRVARASVALPGKARCEDASRFFLTDDNTLLMAVADGAGSAPRAAEGARLAVDAALGWMQYCVTAPDYDGNALRALCAARSAVTQAVEALGRAAEEAGVPVSHYSTTLITIVATPAWLAVSQVGDGAVFAQREDGDIQLITMPERGEYANESRMLTSDLRAQPDQHRLWEGPLHGVAAMTDGLLPITTSLPAYQPFTPFFESLFGRLCAVDPLEPFAEKLRDFLLSEKVQGSTGDDLTLVLAVTESPASLIPAPEAGGSQVKDGAANARPGYPLPSCGEDRGGSRSHTHPCQTSI